MIADTSKIRTAASPFLGSFVADGSGEWRVERLQATVGDTLPATTHLAVVEGVGRRGAANSWVLRGTTSNNRYANRGETDALSSVQEGLGRDGAVKAALIPIKKNAAWWALAQDERRAIFEEQSHHIRIGMDYLPGVARRLYHCRDLGEPFDFLTWFEFAPHLCDAFESLLERLRSTKEWTFVEREVDIRLTRASP